MRQIGLGETINLKFSGGRKARILNGSEIECRSVDSWDRKGCCDLLGILHIKKTRKSLSQRSGIRMRLSKRSTGKKSKGRRGKKTPSRASIISKIEDMAEELER